MKGGLKEGVVIFLFLQRSDDVFLSFFLLHPSSFKKEEKPLGNLNSFCVGFCGWSSSLCES